MRGEQGGTTGVLDRGVGEKRKRERERRSHTYEQRSTRESGGQRIRHELSRRQSKEHKYTYIEDLNGYSRSGWRDGCRCLITYAHRRQDGDSSGSTRCREDFRPQAETRATRANERCATLHTYIVYLYLVNSDKCKVYGARNAP